MQRAACSVQHAARGAHHLRLLGRRKRAQLLVRHHARHLGRELAEGLDRLPQPPAERHLRRGARGCGRRRSRQPRARMLHWLLHSPVRCAERLLQQPVSGPAAPAAAARALQGMKGCRSETSPIGGHCRQPLGTGSCGRSALRAASGAVGSGRRGRRSCTAARSGAERGAQRGGGERRRGAAAAAAAGAAPRARSARPRPVPGRHGALPRASPLTKGRPSVRWRLFCAIPGARGAPAPPPRYGRLCEVPRVPFRPRHTRSAARGAQSDRRAGNGGSMGEWRVTIWGRVGDRILLRPAGAALPSSLAAPAPHPLTRPHPAPGAGARRAFSVPIVALAP
jgi:hypothetical protein